MSPHKVIIISQIFGPLFSWLPFLKCSWCFVLSGTVKGKDSLHLVLHFYGTPSLSLNRPRKVSLETLHNRNPQNSVLPAFLWALPLLQGFSLKSFMYQSGVVLKEHFRNSETWTSRKRNSVAFENRQ